jgi:hypothetical protein
MLRLGIVSYGEENWLKGPYPDSVNLVRPPNTTIPKTLPADARSQYATVFDEVSGKNPLFAPFAPSFSALDIVWLSELKGEVFLETISGKVAALLLNRIILERLAFTGILILGAAGRAYFMQWWHIKKSLASLGAARRSPGKNEAIEEKGSSWARVEKGYGTTSRAAS